MTTTAIAYGRKSFDDPDNRTSSVDDQEMFARDYAKRNSLDVLQFFGDNGITGATMERPGLQNALAWLKAGKAKVLIIEDVDRLGRDQEHLAYMRKLFVAYDVTLHTVVAGKIDDLTFAFKGIVGEQQRARIAYTTRRGLRGKASRGGSTGGKTLGYVRKVVDRAADGTETDRMVIFEEEAKLVRRIFQLYADGNGLKKVCQILNADGIPSPRARETGKYNSGIWNPTTLSGDPQMGEGILNNEAYIGRKIFNRRKWVEIPTENRGFKRVPRLNPEELWIVTEDENLRIIDQDLWDRVKKRQAEARTVRDLQFAKTGNPLSGAKRPQHLLSGLVVCGACGSNFVSAGGRWRCKSANQGSCDNKSITGDELESRALAGLHDQLLTPEVITRFAGHLQKELDAQQRASHGRRAEIEAALLDIQRRSGKILKQVEEDEDAPRGLIARLKVLEEEEAKLEAELSNLPEQTVVRLPANYEAVYRNAVSDLQAHLASENAAASRESVRGMIDKVVVLSGDSRGGKKRRIELHGDLYRMLEFAHVSAAGKTSKRRDVSDKKGDTEIGTPLVAGAGFEPATFRL